MRPLSNMFGRKAVKVPGVKAAPLRILQVTVAASCGLLFLKLGGLLTHGGYTLAEVSKPQPQFARALSSVRTNDDPEFTGSVHGSSDEKAEKPAEAGHDKQSAENKELKLPSDLKPAEKPAPVPPSPAEMQILQRLRERRDSLEQRSQELDLRENLLKATERKVEDRIGELKTVEGKVAAADPLGSPEEAGKQMKTLVTIYENMKPKDAARVFDKLDMKVLVSMVNHMNPRKLSEIVSAMSPDVAQRLTVALATRQLDPVGAPSDSTSLPPGELPRVDVPRR